jgi:hypothetical protein
MIYNVLAKVREILEDDALITTVTDGDLFEVDLSKQTIFPLAHFMLGNVTQSDYTISFELSVMFADIIEEDDSNYRDVWNRTLTSARLFVETLRRGDLDNFEIDGDVVHEPFRDRFTNKLGGFMTTVNIIVPNETAIC